MKSYKLFSLTCVITILCIHFTWAQELKYEIPWKVSYGKGFKPPKFKSSQYSFTVKYLNGISADYRGNISYDKAKNSYVLQTEVGNIYPHQTRYIYRILENDTIIGYRNYRNCWLFKVDSGEINTFSVFANNTDVSVNYVQKKGDTTLHLFTENFVNSGFISLISDDLETLEYYKAQSRIYFFRRKGPIIIFASLLTMAIILPEASAAQIVTALSIPAATPIPLLFIPDTPCDIIRFYNLNNRAKKIIKYKAQ